MPAMLLACILEEGTLTAGERSTFIGSLREHADYDPRLWCRVAASAGGDCLLRHCDLLEGEGRAAPSSMSKDAEVLSEAGASSSNAGEDGGSCDAIDWDAWTADFKAAEVPGGAYDESAYDAAYAEAFEAVQVCGIDDDDDDDDDDEGGRGNSVALATSGGAAVRKSGFEKGGAKHFFQIGGAGYAVMVKSGGEASGKAIKAITKEYRKLSRGQLPSPHPNATIAVRYDAERVSFCRAVVTGPADTPYFGGTFVFDIVFPAE